MKVWQAVTQPTGAGFRLDGDSYEIDSWADAVVPLAAFDDPQWPMPLLATILTDESLEHLAGRLADPLDVLDLPDLRTVAAELIETMFGRPYWTVGRLLGAAINGWDELDGALLLSGVDLHALWERSPARAVNVLWSWMMQNVEDNKQRQRRVNDLTTPPVAVMRQEDNEKAAEIEGDMFIQALAAQGGR